MFKNDPKIPISVLMTAYNTGHVIAQTIQSILNQSFTDFEFVIVNDGSTDNTEDVIFSFNDSRIVYLSNSKNKGIVYSANKGVENCRGKYICRMDSDDICHKNRLKLQYRFMEKTPQCIASSAHYKKIKGSKITSSSKHYFQKKDKEIRVEMLRNAPIAQGCAIIRRELFEEHEVRYDEDYLYCEDYEFWRQAMKYGSLHILNRPLLYYRQHEGQVTRKHTVIQVENANKIRESLIKEIVPEISNNELRVHLALMTDLNSREGISTEDFCRWVDKACLLNSVKKCYDVKLFNRLMYKRLKRLLRD
ncbi:MAG: glycosyltransferase family 2 protein [Desulfuromonadales bacterium]